MTVKIRLAQFHISKANRSEQQNYTLTQIIAMHNEKLKFISDFNKGQHKYIYVT